MNNKIDLSDRTDISPFIVHLTRDSYKNSAKENLVNILNEMKIEARNHHCLFESKLNNKKEEIQKKFYVTCFTETPLNKIKHLVIKVENKKKDFKPYGIIFSKGGLKEYEKSGMKYLSNYPNPSFYVMGDNNQLVQSLFNQFDRWLDNYKNGIQNKFNLFGALINIVNDKHNFRWEREWRTIGDYEFIIPDIVAVIAPKEEHEEIRNEINYYFADAITFIDINWSLEEIFRRGSTFAWNNWHLYYEEITKDSDKK